MPTRTASVTSLSVRPYCRTAETIPASSPSTEAITKAAPARISVAENRSSTSSSTGRFRL
jgi:hypothetical protein